MYIRMYNTYPCTMCVSSGVYLLLNFMFMVRMKGL